MSDVCPQCSSPHVWFVGGTIGTKFEMTGYCEECPYEYDVETGKGYCEECAYEHFEAEPDNV